MRGEAGTWYGAEPLMEVSGPEQFDRFDVPLGNLPFARQCHLFAVLLPCVRELLLAVLVQLPGMPVGAVGVVEPERGYRPGSECDESGPKASDDDAVGRLQIRVSKVRAVDPPRSAPQKKDVGERGYRAYDGENETAGM
ncbi:hypothetical protein [Streptomyces sp. NPDC045251]|uniref:hypothetical protein n=1 Tax=unclassified Streptomyces TaxID=2593676 RepID=UPI0033CC546A